MKEKKSREKKWIKMLLVFFLILFNLIFLYYIKYNNQNLPITSFNIYTIGNILNLFFAFLLLSGLITYIFQKKNLFKPSVILILTILMTIILVVAALTTIVKINFPEFYIYDQPIDKIFTGFLFFSFQFIQFILVSVFWVSLFRRKEFLASRTIIDSAIMTALLLLFSFLFLTFKINKQYANKLPEKGKDERIGVVLGAAVWSGNKPGPSLNARIDKASELLKKNLVDKILFTGGNAPGELSEAEVGYNYLIKKNIDPQKILIEKTTTSTSEQILFIKKNLIKNNQKNYPVIISDSYHLPRVLEICKFYNVSAFTISSGLNLSVQSNIYYRVRESIALLVFWLFAL